MSQILICEFYTEQDPEQGEMVIYTQRQAVMPLVPNWHDLVETWADEHIPGWQNIEMFETQPTNYVVQR